MISVIDYDMGNLRSVAKALERVGAEVRVTRSARAVADSTHVVLPGVGAFGECMRNLDRYGLLGPITGAIGSGKPFLGICLGLQLLFDESEEDGPVEGLGVIPGRVVRFAKGRKEDGELLKVPHMGWNDIGIRKESRLLSGIEDGSYFYFVHSYYAAPDDPSVVLTTTGYGVEFASSVERDNVMACQFHPEKSQGLGLEMLRNFKEMG